MKKAVLVAIMIDDETESDEHRGGYITPRTYHPTGQEAYEIFIGKQPHDTPLFATLAHELGHLLGCIFQLPKTVVDPRLSSFLLSRSPASLMNPEFMIHPDVRVLRSEEEAWDNARALFDIQYAREVALTTYRNKQQPLYLP